MICVYPEESVSGASQVQELVETHQWKAKSKWQHVSPGCPFNCTYHKKERYLASTAWEYSEKEEADMAVGSHWQRIGIAKYKCLTTITSPVFL